MARARGSITAHVTRVMQDQDEVATIVLSQAQLLELISVLTTALREGASHRDGYHLALWKHRQVEQCQASPPCEGGEAMLNLVRPGSRKSTRVS